MTERKTRLKTLVILTLGELYITRSYNDHRINGFSIKYLPTVCDTTALVCQHGDGQISPSILHYARRRDV